MDRPALLTLHEHEHLAGRQPDQPAEAGHLGEVHRHRLSEGGRHSEVHCRCGHTRHGAGDNGDGNGLRDRDHADRRDIHGDGHVHPDHPGHIRRFVGHAAYKITTATAPGTTTYNTNPTTNTTPTTKGTDTIVQQIPKTGTFKLTVTKATVHLTRPKVSGATESSHGTLPGAQVTTTRNTVPGWTVSGQVGTFSSGTHTFPGSDLGWTRAVVSPDHTGDRRARRCGRRSGDHPRSDLGVDVGQGHSGQGHRDLVLGAKLTLVIPSTTPPGTYTATFTVSAI